MWGKLRIKLNRFGVKCEFVLPYYTYYPFFKKEKTRWCGRHPSDILKLKHLFRSYVSKSY